MPPLATAPWRRRGGPVPRPDMAVRALPQVHHPQFRVSRPPPSAACRLAPNGPRSSFHPPRVTRPGGLTTGHRMERGGQAQANPQIATTGPEGSLDPMAGFVVWSYATGGNSPRLSVQYAAPDSSPGVVSQAPSTFVSGHGWSFPAAYALAGCATGCNGGHLRMRAARRR